MYSLQSNQTAYLISKDDIVPGLSPLILELVEDEGMLLETVGLLNRTKDQIPVQNKSIVYSVT